MFQGANAFNGDVSKWNIARVTDMGFIFYQAESFNGDVSKSNTADVTSMGLMFTQATSFKGDVSKWNTAQVTSIHGMDVLWSRSYIHDSHVLSRQNVQR